MTERPKTRRFSGLTVDVDSFAPEPSRSLSHAHLYLNSPSFRGENEEVEETTIDPQAALLLLSEAATHVVNLFSRGDDELYGLLLQYLATRQAREDRCSRRVSYGLADDLEVFPWTGVFECKLEGDRNGNPFSILVEDFISCCFVTSESVFGAAGAGDVAGTRGALSFRLPLVELRSSLDVVAYDVLYSSVAMLSDRVGVEIQICEKFSPCVISTHDDLNRMWGRVVRELQTKGVATRFSYLASLFGRRRDRVMLYGSIWQEDVGLIVVENAEGFLKRRDLYWLAHYTWILSEKKIGVVLVNNSRARCALKKASEMYDKSVDGASFPRECFTLDKLATQTSVELLKQAGSVGSGPGPVQRIRRRQLRGFVRTALATRRRKATSNPLVFVGDLHRSLVSCGASTDSFYRKERFALAASASSLERTHRLLDLSPLSQRSALFACQLAGFLDHRKFTVYATRDLLLSRATSSRRRREAAPHHPRSRRSRGSRFSAVSTTSARYRRSRRFFCPADAEAFDELLEMAHRQESRNSYPLRRCAASMLQWHPFHGSGLFIPPVTRDETRRLSQIGPDCRASFRNGAPKMRIGAHPYLRRTGARSLRLRRRQGLGMAESPNVGCTDASVLRNGFVGLSGDLGTRGGWGQSQNSLEVGMLSLSGAETDQCRGLLEELRSHMFRS